MPLTCCTRSHRRCLTYREDALLALPVHFSKAQSLSRLESNSHPSKALTCLSEYWKIDESVLRRPYIEVSLVACVTVRQEPKENTYSRLLKCNTPPFDSTGEKPNKITMEDLFIDTSGSRSDSTNDHYDESEGSENSGSWMYPTDPRWTGPSDATETSAKRDPDVCDPGFLWGPEADLVDDARGFPTAAHCFFKVPLRGTYQSCRLPVLIAGSKDTLAPAIVSALHQRHTWGLEDPVVGVLYNSTSSQITFALGWYELRKGLVDELTAMVGVPSFSMLLVSPVR